MAQKSSARSTTIASGARKTPSALRNAGRVKKNRDASEPPIARASNLALPDPSEIENRQKREKRPDTAARWAPPRSLTKLSSLVTRSGIQLAFLHEQAG